MIKESQSVCTTDAITNQGNYWFVRWDFKKVPPQIISIVVIDDNGDEMVEEQEVDTNQYYYKEMIFSVEPNYDTFVSTYIRTEYSQSREDAIKSNIINAGFDPNNDRAEKSKQEWTEFEAFREEAKIIGKTIFN